MPPDLEIARIAAGQRGFVKTPQLRAAGLSYRAIERRVAAGRLTPVHHGVYAHGRVADDFVTRAYGAWLAGGPRSALSHSACAGVLRVLSQPEGPIHLRRPSGGRSTDELVFHRGEISGAWEREGMRLVSPVRLMLDLAATESRGTLARAYNEAQVRRLLTPSQVRAALPGWEGRRGVAALRDLVGDDLGATRSFLEDVFVPLVKQAGLPLPTLNRWVEGQMVDAYWERERVVVELDSRTFHDTDPRFESDRKRTNHLLTRGYLALRFTYRRLHQEPFAVIAELAAALDQRRLAA